MMHKLVKTLSVAVLLAAGIGGGLVTVDGSASAAKLHTVKWNKKMKMHKVILKRKGFTKKAYSFKKVHGKKFTFKKAFNLRNKDYEYTVYHATRHAKVDKTIYYYVTGFNGYYSGKHAQSAWIAKSYLEGFETASTQTKKRANTATAKAKAKATKQTTGKTTAASSKTSSKTGSKTSSSKTTTSSKSGSMYVASTKHITWSQWLNLPAFGKEGNGITLYNVDNVPYDEDGFPYVSDKMASASPIDLSQLKSEFTSAAYAAIPDKANTWYLSDKNALYHPTNPEVGQAIRDAMPTDDRTTHTKQSEAAADGRVADISSNVTLIDHLDAGDSKQIIMWASTYGNPTSKADPMNSYTIVCKDKSIASAPSSTTTGRFNITGHKAGDTSVTVTSVNNPNLYERIDVHVQ